MSWIFGYIGNPPQHTQKKFWETANSSLYKHQSETIGLIAGGNPQTLFYSDTHNTKEWIVCGMGLDTAKHKIYSQVDWQHYIHSEKLDDFIDGHYVMLYWDHGTITCKTDRLGLRDIYILPVGSYTLFSTRTDFLARLHSLELDTNSFGSKWLSVTPLTTQSIFKNCFRVCAGNSVQLTKNKMTIQKNPWEPNFTNCHHLDKASIAMLTDQFQNMITLPIHADRPLSVSFSAGFDSRFLLANLLHSHLHNWNVHSFGPDDLPDNRVTKQITEKLNIEHLRFNKSIPSVSDSWQMIYDYASQSLLTDSITAILQLRYFESFRNKNVVLIDGWGGEYWRREFFNKLLYLGQKAIKTKNGKLISQYLRIHRGSVFNQDIITILEQGELHAAQELLDTLPDLQKSGIVNWLDLFAIRTKLPNAMGPEQARIDGICQNYMPLSQYSLLKNLFTVPAHYRKNGRLFREIIQLTSPELTQFPLVKNVSQKPFNMTSLQFRFWEKIHHKLGSLYVYEDKYHFLIQLKEPIMDTFHSKTAQNFDWYQLDHIKNSLEKFFQGDRQYFNEVDWWITFELFRQTHGIN